MIIKKCRSCKSKKIQKLFSLGKLSYTGIFPSTINQEVPTGILTLVMCKDCKLVQLDRNFSSAKMYGINYGYRTSLNSSMKKHIVNKKKFLKKIINLKNGHTILDIGSNDGTFLNCFSEKKYKLIGIDPTIKKFSKFYKKSIIKSPNFFSFKNYKKISNKSNANLITSFAMFYDLQNPVSFAKDIEKCLDDQGIWHFEQSYIVDMINKNSYDTICHEHLEYYSLMSINYIIKQANLKIINIKRNNINGGSIAITVAKKNSKYKECINTIKYYLNYEKKEKIYNKVTFKKFYNKIKNEKRKLKELTKKLRKNNITIVGYGASTKGNVMLQWCGIDKKIIHFIYDINEDKNNCYTPGTKIIIKSNLNDVSEKNFYFLVLPWHFRKYILQKEKKAIGVDQKFIFPLPKVRIN